MEMNVLLVKYRGFVRCYAFPFDLRIFLFLPIILPKSFTGFDSRSGFGASLPAFEEVFSSFRFLGGFAVALSEGRPPSSFL